MRMPHALVMRGDPDRRWERAFASAPIKECFPRRRNDRFNKLVDGMIRGISGPPIIEQSDEADSDVHATQALADVFHTNDEGLP